MAELPYVSQQSPPSTYAIAAVLEGQPGGWPSVFIGTAQRTAFILPGLFVAGLRGRQLFTAALFASVSITTCLFPYYMMRRSGIISSKGGW